MKRCLVALCLAAAACAAPHYDTLIRGGTVIDGTGAPGRAADVAIQGDSIVVVGALGRATADTVIDATGLIVAPGFINWLSHAGPALLHDGRSQGDIRQGVTLEVFGESSMGPLNPRMQGEMRQQQGDLRYDVSWTTLGGFLDTLVARGVAPNVASFVGEGTIRDYVLGQVARAPTAEELAEMERQVDLAMQEGALGLTTALIYAPETFASTDELIALSKVVARSGGIYTAHIRSEGSRLLGAIDETLRIGREAGLPTHIYHLKAAGAANWPKLDSAIAKVDSARAAGDSITADMYLYTAGATGFDAAMPPWVQEGGIDEWVRRLRDPAIRRKVAQEMRTPSDEWESLYLAAGSPDVVMLLGFKTDSLKPLTGRTLGEVARERHQAPEETIIDLVIRDHSRIAVAYQLMSEDNVRRQVKLPWVMFGSDAASMTPEGVFLATNPHPRAYGNFARLLGRYVEGEKLIPLEEAIRRLTSLSAATLHIARRGTLAPGYLADVVVFDPKSIVDHASFEQPHQFSTGVTDVLVNGVPVLRAGEPTGATPGRVVRGPGWRGGGR